MRNTLTLLALCLILHSAYSQQTGKVSKGSLGIGLHWACPQSDLQDIHYDDGLGINLSYLSRKYPYKSPINFQLGVRMDFARLNRREFEDIIVGDENGDPLIGDATLTATNRMYGLLGFGRINFAPEGNKVTPYIDLLIGHRSYTTYQEVELNEPAENPDYEPLDITNRIVHTNRFHYGGSLGLNYRINSSFSVESSITYTFGERGAALPLADITRAEGSNEVRYDNYQTNVKTDLLLINVGIRIDLWKNYSNRQRTNNPTTNTTAPRSNRYRDTTPTTRTGGNTRNGAVRRTPPKKKPLKIKSDGLKKDKNDKS